MGEVEVPWSQYDRAYKRIHDAIISSLANIINIDMNSEVKPYISKCLWFTKDEAYGASGLS
jgi:hypothetical protein